MEKPDVLSDEQIGRALTIDFKETTGKDPKEYFSYVSENDRVIAQAQRDADVEWYEKKYLIPDYEYNLQQARQDTARELIEEIERERFGEPQYIPAAGRDPVVVTLTESFIQELKSKFLIPPNPVGAGDV